MASYQQKEDIPVIGIQVKTFPTGVQQAFGSLMKSLGGRDYYGISWMDESGNIVYYAAAAETLPGEGKQHNYEQLTIKKGDYQTETIHDWRSKTDCIKDIFHDLTAAVKPDKDHPCIEWYKSDDEMLCMVRVTEC